MSTDVAIRNVGEYYAAHYLAEQFARDITDLIKAWKDQGSQAVPRRLQALADPYFKAKTRAVDFPDPHSRALSDSPELDAWHTRLLTALGYHCEPGVMELASEKRFLPVLLRLHRHDRPWLVILQAPFCLSRGDQQEDPLELTVAADTESSEGTPLIRADWEKAVALLFSQEDRPRWAMLLTGSRIYLFDAHTYTQGRYLYIDLDEAYSRRSAQTFRTIAALLAKETLAPESASDEVLHERLREGSIRSTHGVSTKLQESVRQAIEKIANGWVDARRAKNQGYRRLSERESPLPDGSREVTAEHLKNEALVYVYRILFCLYAEAHPQLGILPITDDHYRLGYSLEALRDLADRGEPGTTSQEGTYYAQHLERLFYLVRNGFHPEKFTEPSGKPAAIRDLAQAPEQMDLFGDSAMPQLHPDVNRDEPSDDASAATFIVNPLTATLFDPGTTPLLERVLLPNRVLHPVIRFLSLGRGDKGRQIGRINYAELGIVQLGAVYEGLLSYKGFFVNQAIKEKEDQIDLIQVINATKKTASAAPVVLDNDIDPGLPTWFVPVTRKDEFKKEEIVHEHISKKPRIYKTGEFILHLNGVDRAHSASYYTPLPLTHALVREALKERLTDFTPDQADEILKLTICEPAMGSAAFLVEAIDQLAHHYLNLKQKQTGKTIDPGEYEDEHRRVRHYIAVHNVYGVDLNATAVALGSLSLWLATIHRLKIESEDRENSRPERYRPGATPWFGLRLRNGNSLIGARRAVWTEKQLRKGDFFGKNAGAPRQLRPGENRNSNEIYHFLIWDEDMGPASRDRLMRSHWPSACKTMMEWRKTQVMRKWNAEEIAAALAISDAIDRLWESYARKREDGLKRTRCTATVWPEPGGSNAALTQGPTLKKQEAVKATLESESGAFQRLKLLMDTWCALYFWPLDQADSLPGRDAWLAAARVLFGMEEDDTVNREMIKLQIGNAFDLDALFDEIKERRGINARPDADRMAHAVPWFKTARDIDTIQHFHHWELIFTEILGPGYNGRKQPPKGFDLIFGNPPWRKVTWNDAPLLAEFEPLLGVRNAKSATYNRQRSKLLENETHRQHYREEFEQGEGSAVFLNDRTLYPALAGVQTNLYKNFIERSWGLLGDKGIAGLLHPVGVYDDPRGGSFRSYYFKRLISHYQLSNQLMWFPDAGHRNPFSINIYGVEKKTISFNCIFNVFHPDTIQKCFDHKNISDNIPGIKDNSGKWEKRGHISRILTITESELNLFARLFEDESTSGYEARLPQIHSGPLMKVLGKIAKAPKRLADLKGEYLATEMFHESNAQRDGLITREDNPSFQPKNAEEWVISGPHFFIGTPFYKTPRSICTQKGHYDDIDLTEIPEDYLPRAVYRPGDRKGDLTAFYRAIPEWPKPSRPGFWPVKDDQIPAYEALLGEPLKLYGIDPKQPGAKTARKFGYFSVWEGDVEGAVRWLMENGFKSDSRRFSQKFSEVFLEQKIVDEYELQYLPKPLTCYPKYAVRAMCQPANERTLIGTVMPEGTGGINSVRFVSFLSAEKLFCFTAFACSIVADFFIKIKGRNNIHDDDLKKVPILFGTSIELAVNRLLRLICLTKGFSSLWEKAFNNMMTEDSFTINDPVANLYQKKWRDLEERWNKNFGFVTDYTRRQALLEIDTLVALSLQLTIEELIQIYEVQFPVMKAYEAADEYDAAGRRLPNTVRKDAGARELRDARKDHDGQSPLTVTWQVDNGSKTVTKTFYPPFTHVDRIADYQTAYRVFKKRLGI